jgi:hypothetical protein
MVWGVCSCFYHKGREEEIEGIKGFGLRGATLSLAVALSGFYRRGREGLSEGRGGIVLCVENYILDRFLLSERFNVSFNGFSALKAHYILEK